MTHSNLIAPLFEWVNIFFKKTGLIVFTILNKNSEKLYEKLIFVLRIKMRKLIGGIELQIFLVGVFGLVYKQFLH